MPTYNHRAGVVGIVVGIISICATVIASLNYYYMQTLCSPSTIDQEWMNYVLIGCAAALLFIFVYVGYDFSRKHGKRSGRVVGLGVLWAIAVAGTVFACLNEPNVRSLKGRCAKLPLQSQWITYALIGTFGVTTLFLMGWGYAEAVHVKTCRKQATAKAGGHPWRITGAPVSSYGGK